MKTVNLFIAILFCISSPGLAADDAEFPPPVLEQIETQSREMSRLGVDYTDARMMLTQMHRSRFTDPAIAKARQTVMQCIQADLPTEPVISKAMEGIAKHANEAQILAAMEAVHSRYATASDLASTLSEDRTRMTAMTHAIADSLAAGMTARDMESIAVQLKVRTQQATRNQAEALALQTLQTTRTMARLGIRSAEVSDTLRQALQNRYTVQEMRQLQSQMARHAHHSSAQQIAAQHAGAIGKGGAKGNAGSSGVGGSGSGGGGAGGAGAGGTGGGGSGGSGGAGGGGAGGSGGGGGSGAGGGGGGGGGGVR